MFIFLINNVDTGAATSILKENIFPRHYESKLDKPVIIKALYNENQINSKIILPLPIEFNKKESTMEFLITPITNSSFDGILGNNILIPLEAEISFYTHTLKIKNTIIPLMTKPKEYPLDRYIQELSNTQIDLCGIDVALQDLTDKLTEHYMNKEEKKALNHILKNNKQLFYSEGDILTNVKEVTHNIETKSDKPIYSRLYRYPEVHTKEVDKQIIEMLDQGIIKESNSPYNAPIWVVPKKIDNSGLKKWRIVIDYRKLNEVTVEDKFPIPNIEDIFSKLGRSQYFTTLDLAKGFHQILVNPKDRYKTAFSTANGHYEFNRMPFGLKNAPATFQRMINHVLEGLVGKICVVYLDDILIFSTSLEEHICSINKVFKKLNNHNLKIQIDKCKFFSKETEYLGHVITTNGIKPNPEKIRTIEKIPIPGTTKQIKSFLVLTGYYRKFIKDYSKVAVPMTKYLKKGAKINIKDPEYITAFEELKLLISNDPVLKYPDYTKEFVLTTDASNYAIGSVLSQSNHPLCYASRTLNEHERRYSTIEKELLSIVWSTKYFRPYLYGRKFKIQTDHRPLIWLSNLKEPNSKLQRWKISLNEYDFDIEYLKGKENRVADYLSRLEVNAVNRNEDSTLATIHSGIEERNDHIGISELPTNMFKHQIEIIESEDEGKNIKYIYKGIRRLTIKSKDIGEYFTEALREFLPDHGNVAVYCPSDTLFCKIQEKYVELYSNQSKLKLLRCITLLKDLSNTNDALNLIQRIHEQFNHRGIQETYLEIKNEYYFPKLREIIRRYINNCTVCQTAKHDRSPEKIKFEMSKTALKPNELIHMDIYIPSKDIYFLTIIDKFTKHLTAFPIASRNTHKIIEQLKLRNSILGKPQEIVCDNEFNSLAFKEYCNEEGIKIKLITPNHKTGNSDVERVHGTLNEHIRIYNAQEEKKNILNLREKVIKAVSIYNCTIHSTILRKPIDFIQNKIKVEDLEEIGKRIQTVKENNINKRNQNKALNQI